MAEKQNRIEEVKKNKKVRPKCPKCGTEMLPYVYQKEWECPHCGFIRKMGKTLEKPEPPPEELREKIAKIARIENWRTCSLELRWENGYCKDKECSDCKADQILSLAQQYYEPRIRIKDAECQARIEALIDAYESMLDGMGLGKGNFKKSDWEYKESLKARLGIKE